MAGPSSAPQCCMKREIELDKVVCRFYVSSQCEDGDKCPFPHVPREGKLLDSACRYFMKSKCHFGKQCSLDHVIISERNGKKIIQIIQQQLGARKRLLESLNFNVQVIQGTSPNAGQQADLVEDLGGAISNISLSPESKAGNISIPGPSKKSANKQRLAIDPIKRNVLWEERKMSDTGSTEYNLLDFYSRETLQKPENSEKAQRLLIGSTQSDFKSGEPQLGSAIALESEWKDLRSCATSQKPVQKLCLKRSEVEQQLISGSSKSKSKHEDRISDGSLVAKSSSQVRGSRAASQQAVSGFDPNVPMVLYNTAIVPKGRTAEEIALFGEFAFLPVDNNSRVPLYMRGATAREPTSESVGKQTKSAKKSKKTIASKQSENDKADESFVSKQMENDKKTEENNGASQQQTDDEKYIYTPSGRRVGVQPQYSFYFQNQDEM